MSCTRVLKFCDSVVSCQTRYTSHLVPFETVPSCDARSTTARTDVWATETRDDVRMSTLSRLGLTPVARCHLNPWPHTQIQTAPVPLQYVVVAFTCSQRQDCCPGRVRVTGGIYGVASLPAAKCLGRRQPSDDPRLEDPDGLFANRTAQGQHANPRL
ncbi:hypothetical protein HDV57DRAFT_33461 [Trichoderma longibrachiatum]|uniref:Uncharacterized protein n=1 Tax=Trichoderma longibrachiatum ATCC 18648 TaxID=983965 RepID=A0A2T4CHX7_TRILO|nr:hypothetical protein M440DRAFT_1008372 [Trichoderma longibrachiatum ATCC 18648]